MENQILETLLEKRYSFNELAIHLACNRNSLSKQLKILRRNGSIHVATEGQKRFFSLTQKGQAEGARLACNNISQGLKTLKLFSSNLNPAKVKERFEAEIKAINVDSIIKRDEEKDNEFLDNQRKEYDKWDAERKKLNENPVNDGGNRLKIIEVMMENCQFNIQTMEDKMKVEQPHFLDIFDVPVCKELKAIAIAFHGIRCGIWTGEPDKCATVITGNDTYFMDMEKFRAQKMHLGLDHWGSDT